VIAAEQKARATYDNILRLSDDPDVNDAIKFLREREIVHYQRFGDTKLTNSNRFHINIKGAEERTSAPKIY
jgi:Mn-containing catalase